MLIERMLPERGRRSLTLKAGTVPAFLAHQRECNDLAISLAGNPATRWVSSWDRPFTPSIGGVAMPQPDLVLVRSVRGSEELVFVEHDRGNESRAHFEHAKISRYAQLARLPQFCEDVLGFRSFRVAVSVVDAQKSRPEDRQHEIERWVDAAGASRLFTVAGVGAMPALIHA